MNNQSTCSKYKAIEQLNKERIKLLYPQITENSGVYIFYRKECGIDYAYIGQATNLLQRTSQHLSGYQHIDLSLKKRGLWSNENPAGWCLATCECDVGDLDDKEQEFILRWAKHAQLYNHTTGGQGIGKHALGETKPKKSYHDGLRQGRKRVIHEIRHLFKLYLSVNTKSDKPTKNAVKALQKFQDMLQEESE